MKTTKRERKQRIPVSGPRDILSVANKDPNYVYRWVLDVPGRLAKFQDGGYEFVVDDHKIGDETVDKGKKLGSAFTMVRGTSTLVLMRIPREWYEEDQQMKQEEIDALEATMRSGSSGDYGKVEIASRK